MKPNFTSPQKFKTLKNNLIMLLESSKSPQLAVGQLTSKRIIPNISEKRRGKIKHKSMLSNAEDKVIIQQCQPIKDHNIGISNAKNDDMENSNDDRLQAMRNESYLKKKKNHFRLVKNQGISMLNPNRSCWKMQQLKPEDSQTSGLHKFTNIVIKSLQKKQKKVSFSQFLQLKKQQVYQNKFKYNQSKKNPELDAAKKQFIHSIEQGRSRIASRKNKCSLQGHENINKHSKSVILTDNKRLTGKNRVYSKMNERYHSISGLTDSIDMKMSLQILKIKANQ